MNSTTIWKCAILPVLLLCGSAGLLGQSIDVNQKPKPLPVKDFTFPAYEEVTLKNGLKVFIIEDNEQPTIAFRLQVHAGTAYDTDLPGTADATAGILTKGAGNMDALQLAKKLDGIGANISASATGEAFSVFASGLKKHTDIILGVFSDVILRPKFDAEEYKKFQSQWIEGLRSEKADAGAVGQNMARQVAYGEDHPYAIRATEEAAKDVTVEAIRTFHATYFKPNNATLAVVGDFTKAEILPLLEKAFGGWSKGTVPDMNIPDAQSMPKGVYFVERPTSVQSSVILTGLAVPYKHEEYDAARVAGYVMGIGFGGRLFRTLRETYSYTYTPFGFITQAKRDNRFVCGADVRNEVTDSTIIVTKRELRELTQTPPDEAELNRIKRYITGTFLMSFENTQFVASQLQNAVLNEVSVEHIKSFPERTMNITPKQVQEAAAKYMNPDELRLVVVGSPSVIEKVEQFGEIKRYDIDLKPIEQEEVAMSWEDFLKKHVEALGGEKAINGLKTLKTESDVTLVMQGRRAPGSLSRVQQVGAKSTSEIEIPGAIPKSGAWCNGQAAWQTGPNGSVQEASGRELDAALFNSLMYPRLLTGLKEIGFSPKFAGKKSGTIVVQASSQQGVTNVIYVNADTYLVEKIESVQESAQGTMQITEEFSNFVKTGGVMLPANSKQSLGAFAAIEAANKYSANVAVDEGAFAPPGNN